MRALLGDWTMPLRRRLETDVHPLRYLFLEVTRRCNLRCRHCGSDCSRAPVPGELSTAEWCGFIEGLAARTRPRSILMVLTGGEPLCHPELSAILQTVRRCGFPWGMVTNGWSLDGETLGTLLSLGLRSLTVSLDGLRPSHDWLRGVAGSFDRALAACELLAEAGPPVWDVVTCAHPRNLEELPEVHALLARVGVPVWRIFTIFPRGRAATSDELLLKAEELRSLLDWIASARSGAARGGLLPSYGCEGYLPASVDRAVRDQPYFCRAGINIASVLADGSIGACPNIDPALIQGNTRGDDFLRVWEDRFEAFRDRSWMRTGHCAECGEWPRCQGNSLHLWDTERAEPALCHFSALQ